MKMTEMITTLGSNVRQFQSRLTNEVCAEFSSLLDDLREQYDVTKTQVIEFGAETVPAWWESRRKATVQVIASGRQTQQQVMCEASLTYQKTSEQIQIWFDQAEQSVISAFAAIRKPDQQAAFSRQQGLDRLKTARELDVRARDEHLVHRNLLSIGIAFGLALTSLIHPFLGLLSVPPLLYACRSMFERAYQEIRLRKPGIDVMMALTVAGGIALQMFILSSLSIMVFLATRKLLLMVTEDSRGRMLDVFAEMPQSVWVRVNGVEISLPFHDVSAGDIVVVSAGDPIPVDGTVTDGIAVVDQHVLTGESAPVSRGSGDKVFASTLVLSGKLAIRTEQAGTETTIAKIGQTLNNTIEFKSRVELRAERLTEATVTPTLLVAAGALPLLGGYGAIGVVDAHFKAKMALLAPIGILNYFQIALKNGILFKDGRSLDLLNHVDTLVFDKTGTLTENQPSVKAIHTCAAYAEAEVLQYAAAAESRQTHPIAQAILREAEVRKVAMPVVSDAAYQLGYGLSVRIDATLVQVGSARFLRLNQIEIPHQIQNIQAYCHQQGDSLIFVAINGNVIGAIELMPAVRPEAKTIIETLRTRFHITKTYILSGDHEQPTSVLAQALGIDAYHAEMLPEQKADLIRQLQAQGRSVCYIGDGLNDAIALKEAHVSISLRGATTLATDMAQIVLLDRGLTHLPTVFDLAQRFERNSDVTFGIILGSTIVGIGGVFLLGWGLWETLIVGLLGFAGGSVTVMLPRLFARPLRALPERTDCLEVSL